MKNRCTNPKDPGYKHYGARGIKVCERWLDVRNFVEDMYSTYAPDLYLDRENNDGDYTIDNCRWVTQSKNSKNTRRKASQQSELDYVHYNKQWDRWMVAKPFKFKQEAEKLAKFIEEYYRG